MFAPAFAGPFVSMGFTESEARRYEEEFKAGRTIVVVRTEDRAEEALLGLRAFEPLHAEITGPHRARVSV